MDSATQPSSAIRAPLETPLGTGSDVQNVAHDDKDCLKVPGAKNNLLSICVRVTKNRKSGTETDQTGGR